MKDSSFLGTCQVTMLLASAAGIRQRETLTADLRCRLRACLQTALERGADLTPDRAKEMAAVLEMCALALTRCNADLLVATVSRVKYNLGANGAHILRQYPPSRVCLLSQRRMGAETAHALRDASIEQEAKQLLADAEAAAKAAQARATTVTATEAIWCPKCKTRDGIIRVAQQSRAADEGMTTKCFCVKCNQRWKLA